MKLTNLLIIYFIFQFTTPPTLQQASYKYLATTEKEVFEISHQIIPDGGKPGNICGPLALSILEDAGYVSKEIPVKSFWFLRPFDEYTQKTILERAFPKDSWNWYFFKESIKKFDFKKFPLLPGDVIFLPYNYTCGGTFSHIFVITRIDALGNPYTVTNHLTEDGWRISELLVYDRTGQRISYFDILTNRRNTNTIGTTGFCGFYLWRQKIIYQFDSLPCTKHYCPY